MVRSLLFIMHAIPSKKSQSLNWLAIAAGMMLYDHGLEMRRTGEYSVEVVARLSERSSRVFTGWQLRRSMPLMFEESTVVVVSM